MTINSVHLYVELFINLQLTPFQQLLLSDLEFTMHILGTILALLSVCNVFNALLHDNEVNSASSLNIYSKSSGAVATSVSYPAIDASVLSPANLVERMDPLPYPTEMWSFICRGLQWIDAMQLAVFTFTNSLPPRGGLNTPSIFTQFRQLSRYWTTYTELLGCGDLVYLNSILQALGGLTVDNRSYRTWTLRFS